MADETQSTEVTETDSPAASAVEQPADAEASVQNAPHETGPDQVSAEAAAEDDWFSKEGDPAPATDADGTKTETQPKAADNGAKGQQATTPGPLDDDMLTVLKRAQVAPEDFLALPEKSRMRFYASQLKNQATLDKLYAERQQPAPQQGQQPPASQGQPNAQSEDDDPLKALEAEYGEAYVAPFRKKFEAQANQYQQIQQTNSQLLQRLVNDDFAAGLEKAALPAGIDATKPEVRDAILRQAVALAQVEGITPQAAIATGYLRHAIPKAAASLYPHEYLAAKTDQQKTEQAKRLRGSPTRVSAIPKSRPEVASSEDERERNWLDENKDVALSI